jgi:hypothetical protein
VPVGRGALGSAVVDSNGVHVGALEAGSIRGLCLLGSVARANSIGVETGLSQVATRVEQEGAWQGTNSVLETGTRCFTPSRLSKTSGSLWDPRATAAEETIPFPFQRNGWSLKWRGGLAVPGGRVSVCTVQPLPG